MIRSTRYTNRAPEKNITRTDQWKVLRSKFNTFWKKGNTSAWMKTSKQTTWSIWVWKRFEISKSKGKSETAAVATGCCSRNAKTRRKQQHWWCKRKPQKKQMWKTPQNLDEYARTAAEQVERVTMKHPVPSATRVQRWFTSWSRRSGTTHWLLKQSVPTSDVNATVDGRAWTREMQRTTAEASRQDSKEDEGAEQTDQKMHQRQKKDQKDKKSSKNSWRVQRNQEHFKHKVCEEENTQSEGYTTTKVKWLHREMEFPT